MRTVRQALADIAKLCEGETWWGHVDQTMMVSQVRAILADVEPDPAPGWSEGESAVQALRQLGYVKSTDHVTGSVSWHPPRPTSASGTIDRDALREIVADYGADEDAPLGATLDAILALVRPVEGVVLTREEALNAKAALNYTLLKATLGPTDTAEYGALVVRLEAVL